MSIVVGPPWGSSAGGRIVVVWYQSQAAIRPRLSVRPPNIIEAPHEFIRVELGFPLNE